MRKYVLLILLLFLTALAACSGGGSGGETASTGGTTESGSVALFITDNLADFSQVTATITEVTLLHTGSGTSCSIFSGEETVNLAELASESLLLDITNCPAQEYNRIRVETNSSVVLTQNHITDECTFVSYKDEHNNTNVLECDDTVCSLEINGIVNVFADQENALTLDFDLKEFEVENFGELGCTATMKVKPLSHDDVDDKKEEGMKESIKGVVSELNIETHTFTLTREKHVFTVLYNNVSQEGIDELLTLAQDNSLKTRAVCSLFNLESNECTASEINVGVEGIISELTETTFILTFNPEINVYYTGAKICGTLVNEAKAEVMLSGFNGTAYLAYEVEIRKDHDVKDAGELIKGIVSELNIEARTFTLTRGEHSFTILYNDVLQEGIDELLTLSQENGLKTRVVCSKFNPDSNECAASEVDLGVGGIISGLVDTTFLLTFNPEISVDYSGAAVYGALANEAEAEVMLFGFNGTDYLAYEIEIREKLTD